MGMYVYTATVPQSPFPVFWTYDDFKPRSLLQFLLKIKPPCFDKLNFIAFPICLQTKLAAYVTIFKLKLPHFHMLKPSPFNISTCLCLPPSTL